MLSLYFVARRRGHPAAVPHKQFRGADESTRRPMNTEEIRDEIVTKLAIEREVREQLAKQQAEQNAPPRKSRWAWLESKLGLLVIGAIFSGVLVPVFQYTQERVKWHQQNRYNALVLQTTNMRESLKQFITVQALSAAMYDIGLDVLLNRNGTTTAEQLAQWRKDLRALQQKRIEQNSAFAASVFYFPAGSQAPIRESWNELLKHSERMQEPIYTMLEWDPKSSHVLDRNKLVTALDTQVFNVNQTYDQLLGMLRKDLLEVEDASSQFR